jgi:serine/threonine-protein kinase
MPSNPRVAQLLEELLDSGGTPEEACRTCPELLPQVRAGWQRLRAIKAEVGALFPPSPVPDAATPSPLPTADLPRIRGYDVREVLGRGGMGVVYEVEQISLRRRVAAPRLAPSVAVASVGGRPPIVYGPAFGPGHFLLVAS